MVNDKTILVIVMAILVVILFFVYAIMVSNGVGTTTSAMVIVLPLITLGVVLAIANKKNEEGKKQGIDARDRYSSNTSN